MKSLIAILSIFSALFLYSSLSFAQSGECYGRLDYDGSTACVGDFDGDWETDDMALLTEFSSSSYKLEIILNSVNSFDDEIKVLERTWKKPWTLMVDDFDGNGMDDILALDLRPNLSSSAEKAKLMLSSADGYDSWGDDDSSFEDSDINFTLEEVWADNNSSTWNDDLIYMVGKINPSTRGADIVVVDDWNSSVMIRSDIFKTRANHIVKSYRLTGNSSNVKVINSELIDKNIDGIAIIDDSNDSNWSNDYSDWGGSDSDYNLNNPQVLGNVIALNDNVCVRIEDSYGWEISENGNCDGIDDIDPEFEDANFITFTADILMMNSSGSFNTLGKATISKILDEDMNYDDFSNWGVEGSSGAPSEDRAAGTDTASIGTDTVAKAGTSETNGCNLMTVSDKSVSNLNILFSLLTIFGLILFRKNT